MSFRLERYDRLLGSLAGRDRVGVADFIGRPLAERRKLAILRHDVDRLAWRAVAMAGLEAQRGVRTTYYFRCSPAGEFPWQAIEAIRDLGHEVGYHYECLSACNGDRDAALAQFQRNLAALRAVALCRTVAMHGAPLSAHRNQDLLVGLDLAKYDLVADASLSFTDVQLAYFTDTGGSWTAGSATNFRDRVGVPPAATVSPDEPGFQVWLSAFPEPVYVSTHPERWPRSGFGYVQARLFDQAVNLAKRLLAARRGRRVG